MSRERLDPRTPVLVGVGQASDPVDAAAYRAWSSVELAADAARRAVEDTGASGRRTIGAIEVVAGVRQFEISTPGARVPLGRSDNFPRSVADRIGADPARAVLEVAGGQAPQHLVNEFGAAIAEGMYEAVLLVGGEAISTTRHFAGRDDAPDFSEKRGGQLDDRGFGLAGLISEQGIQHGLVDAPSQYALFENARRSRLGLSRDEYARSMGELFSPFTRVAAKNPHAAVPVERSGEQLVATDDRNRLIADPYPRFLVARDQVNQGAAVLLMSVDAARRLRVPRSRWVFVHGHADLVEKPLLERTDLSTSPASVLAVQHAVDVAGIGLADVDHLDLYSCFPIAVSNFCDALGLRADDPRGLTVTGGLPFFGGAGNNYSMHAIAEMVTLLRETPGSHGLVGANGGVLSKYSVGVYSTDECEWCAGDSGTLQQRLDRVSPVPTTAVPSDRGSIETWTIRHDKSGPRGIVVGRDADGRRFVARVAPEDHDTMDLLESGDPAGTTVSVLAHGKGNMVSVGRVTNP